VLTKNQRSLLPALPVWVEIARPAPAADNGGAMNLLELSQRIKKLRRDRGMTLEQAADQMGLTRSWLSKVENFRVTPSLPALGKIASTYGVSLGELLDGLDVKPQFIIVRENERLRFERDDQSPNIIYQSLAHKRSNRQMDPVIITLPPGEGRPDRLPHEGEEFLIVLTGKVDFEYDGQQHQIMAGDSIYFEATTPHRLVNPYSEDAQVLCVFLHHRSDGA